MDQDVARMRIGMEEVVDEDLFHKVFDQDVSDVLTLGWQIRIILVTGILWKEVADTLS